MIRLREVYAAMRLLRRKAQFLNTKFGFHKNINQDFAFSVQTKHNTQERTKATHHHQKCEITENWDFDLARTLETPMKNHEHNFEVLSCTKNGKTIEGLKNLPDDSDAVNQVMRSLFFNRRMLE